MILILSIKKPGDCPFKILGTVPKFDWETTALSWAVGGGFER